MKQETDLSMATTEEMIEELQKRNLVTVICLERVTKLPGKHETLILWSGGLSAGIGLADRAKTRMLTRAEPAEAAEEG